MESYRPPVYLLSPDKGAGIGGDTKISDSASLAVVPDNDDARPLIDPAVLLTNIEAKLSNKDIRIPPALSEILPYIESDPSDVPVMVFDELERMKQRGELNDTDLKDLYHQLAEVLQGSSSSVEDHQLDVPETTLRRIAELGDLDDLDVVRLPEDSELTMTPQGKNPAGTMGRRGRNLRNGVVAFVLITTVVVGATYIVANRVNKAKIAQQSPNTPEFKANANPGGVVEGNDPKQEAVVAVYNVPRYTSNLPSPDTLDSIEASSDATRQTHQLLKAIVSDVADTTQDDGINLTQRFVVGMNSVMQDVTPLSKQSPTGILKEGETPEEYYNKWKDALLGDQNLRNDELVPGLEAFLDFSYKWGEQFNVDSNGETTFRGSEEDRLLMNEDYINMVKIVVDSKLSFENGMNTPSDGMPQTPFAIIDHGENGLEYIDPPSDLTITPDLIALLKSKYGKDVFFL